MEDDYRELGPEQLEERRRRDFCGQGQALGSLLKGVLDREIPIHFETRARHLRTEGSRVTGVVAEQAGTTLRIRAREGVVIATGGFEWNEQLVKTFLRGRMTGPISVPECGSNAMAAVTAGVYGGAGGPSAPG